MSHNLTLRACATRVSLPMSWLHTLAANPYIVLLARRITSSSVLNGTTQTTGPSGRQGGRGEGERRGERKERGGRVKRGGEEKWRAKVVINKV